MKKHIAFLLAMMLLLTPMASFATEVAGYEGGINNENTYKEVIFVTGEPIELEGTLDIKVKEKGDTITEQYKYKLENLKMNAKLTRTVKLIEKTEVKGNQITSTKVLDGYRETITIGKKKYEVKEENYLWNQGNVVHNTPLNGYHAGDWSARKTYSVDKGKETIQVQTIGNMVGYDSPWSATETQTLQYTINYEDKLGKKTPWEGTAVVETSYNRTKDYAYVDNVPNQISFKGGFILTEKHDNVLKYSYDLPRFKEGEVDFGRNMGTNSTSIDTNPIITRLNIPAVRDVLGLPNEKDILLLASMDGLPLESTYLGAQKAMSRGDFARAIVKAMGIEIKKQDEKVSRSKRKKVEEKQPTFIDVKKTHRNYDYIETAVGKNIMQGVGKGRFEPDRELTRAEATTILIRLLGFQNLAPIGKYSTGFKDDSKIPTWAKDHIYVAKMLGIIEGGEYFYPNSSITKAETSELIVKFINYLQNQLKYDYRENILNF